MAIDVGPLRPTKPGPDYRHVSKNDLRRRFGQQLLVDNDVDPRVVMQVGG